MRLPARSNAAITAGGDSWVGRLTPNGLVLFVATSSSTRHYQDRSGGRLLRRLTKTCGRQSATTETAVVDKPAEEEDHGHHHGHGQ